MGEKQAIWKLRQHGKLIRAIRQALDISNTTIWNVWGKKWIIGIRQ